MSVNLEGIGWLDTAESHEAFQMGAKSERDLIVRWLKCRVQNLHTNKVLDPDLRASRDAVSAIISRLALDISDGAGSDLTRRSTPTLKEPSRGHPDT